jgi:hypothetical protein
MVVFLDPSAYIISGTFNIGLKLLSTLDTLRVKKLYPSIALTTNMHSV